MYKNKFTEIELEKAVLLVKQTFMKNIEHNLNLIKVSSPLFLNKTTGLNDHLTNDGKPITFVYQNTECEIVQSLAKWKREEVNRLHLNVGQGIWTNMKAIRANEEKLSPYHSLYVEQFDWEKAISKKDRTIEYLKKEVNLIYASLKNTITEIQKTYPFLKNTIPNELTFITTEELYMMYPKLNAKERENEFAKKSKAFFLIGIGHKLSHNKPHDDRAADYDDWNLNGDLILFNQMHNNAMELSSMGIRVDSEALINQSIILNEFDKLNFEYHEKIKNNHLPLTIGGGIGQSRLVLFVLEQYHIGEFQSSFWPQDIIDEMTKLEVKLK